MEQQLAEVIGMNCKRLRLAQGVTQDQLAQCAHAFGLRWSASKVADFEAGRSAPTFATVLAAAAALGADIYSLIQSEEPMWLNPALSLPTRSVVGLLLGGGAKLQPTSASFQSTLAICRMARQLGVDREELCSAAHQLWKSSFDDERDRRAGPGANPQKKGRITREMRDELGAKLEQLERGGDHTAGMDH